MEKCKNYWSILDSSIWGEGENLSKARAGELPGFTEYPNPQVGYGALCVRESLPE